MVMKNCICVRLIGSYLHEFVLVLYEIREYIGCFVP